MENMAGYIAVGVTVALFVIVIVFGVLRGEKGLGKQAHREVKEKEGAE